MLENIPKKEHTYTHINDIHTKWGDTSVLEKKDAIMINDNVISSRFSIHPLTFDTPIDAVRERLARIESRRKNDRL